MQQLVRRATFGGYVLPPVHRGLGATTPAQTVQQVGAVATPVVSAAAAPAVASILAGSSAVTGATLALAGGLVTVAFVGVLMGVEAILNSGCGQSCVETSQWANQAEPLLLQNIQTYFAKPAPRSILDQQSALNLWTAVWGGLVQRCSQPGLSTAGQKCISDRQAGACTWKQTTTSPLLAFPNEPQPGQCWNWDSGYRAPIALDPAQDLGEVPVVQDSTGGLTSTTTATGSSSDILLYAGLAVLLLGAMK